MIDLIGGQLWASYLTFNALLFSSVKWDDRKTFVIDCYENQMMDHRKGNSHYLLHIDHTGFNSPSLSCIK